MNSTLMRVAARCLAANPTELNTGWEDILVPYGIALVGNAYNDHAMLDWAERWVEYHLAAEPVRQPEDGDEFRQASGDQRRGIYLTGYAGEWGAPLVLATVRRKNIEAIRLVADHICDGSIRLEDGTITHGPGIPTPVWVDTLYYTAAPLAAAFGVTGDLRYATEAISQCLLHAEHLVDLRTGCWYHDADPAAGTTTGSLWSRGNGWAVATIADVLANCPRDMPDWRTLLDRYRQLVTGLLRYQHPSGLWRIVPDNDESHLETSGSALIATGIAVGISHGLLDPALSTRVERTWHELSTWVNNSDAVQGCQSPAGMSGWELHKHSAMGEWTYGTGSFLRLAAELRIMRGEMEAT